MIRRLIAVALALAVYGGAVCAPFLHAHVDGHVGTQVDDHRATAVHAHFSSHAPAHVEHDGISVEDADRDHPIYLQVFVAVESTIFQTPAMPRAVFAAIPMVEHTPRPSAIVTHGHDPPLVHALDSRPPPLLLS